MSVRSYIIDDREQKTFLLDREVLVSDDILRTEMSQHLRPLLDLCRPRLRAEEAGRFRLPQGRRPAGDLLPRPEGRRSTACSTPAATAARSCAPSARAIARRFQCIYHGWTYNNDGSLVGVPGDDAYAESFDKSAYGLRRPARFEEYRGFWFMNLDEDADPLVDYLAGAKDYIDLVIDQSPSGPDGDHRRQGRRCPSTSHRRSPARPTRAALFLGGHGEEPLLFVRERPARDCSIATSTFNVFSTRSKYAIALAEPPTSCIATLPRFA